LGGIGASESEALIGIAEALSPAFPVAGREVAPFVLVNPDLVDMGATGLGYAARNLRKNFVETFETCYCLRVTTWGLLLRQYPGKWTGFMQKEGAAAEEWEMVEVWDKRPGQDEIAELQKKMEAASGKKSGSSPLAGFKRFLKAYMRG